MPRSLAKAAMSICLRSMALAQTSLIFFVPTARSALSFKGRPVEPELPADPLGKASSQPYSKSSSSLPQAPRLPSDRGPPFTPAMSFGKLEGMDLSKIFKAYDIRGVYPEEIDEAKVKRIAMAYAKFTGAKIVAVGRDVRLSGPKLQKSVIDGLLEAGVNVEDIGPVPTDMMYFAVGFYHFD